MHRLVRCTLFPYTTLFRSSSLQFSCEPLSVVDSPLQQQLPKHSKGEDCTSMKVNRNLFFTALTLTALDRKSTRLNSSHSQISYAVFCLKKKKNLDLPFPLI